MHDIIIVGAGTAGCVLAERLTASGRLKVLLVEAGERPATPFVKIPAGFAKLFKSKVDWNFESEPQSAAANRRIFTPRGRMLGGSSNMNAQIHQWCHPADFAGWVAAGASGWGWEDVSPVFRAQENWQGEDGGQPRGHDGPMFVSPNRNVRPLARAFVDAARAAGLNGPADYNGGAYAGAWLCQLAHRAGRRYSAYDAYLEPAMRRANLEVMTGAHAMRVGFQDGRAACLTVRRGGAEHTLEAARGIVLATGTFGSPQLLMVSGVGPADELRRLGIAIRRDAPEVGANLQDHPLLALVFRTRRRDTLKRAESLPSLLRYLLFKRGMLASNAVEAFAFTSVAGGAGAPPDLELLFAPLEWRKEGLETPKIHAFSIGSIVVTPRSRGRVSLAGPDPLSAPRIDFGLLGDPEGADAAIAVAGIRLAREIAATMPLAADCAEEVYPGQAMRSDAELRASLAARVQTVYHPTSTCRMGSDPRAVVTPDLRVAGIDGLWVADASVMPAVPRGHPNAVVAMIAQRAAAMVEAGP
jgi:choline dehydrogenase-like flavoprotein